MNKNKKGPKKDKDEEKNVEDMDEEELQQGLDNAVEKLGGPFSTVTLMIILFFGLLGSIFTVVGVTEAGRDILLAVFCLHISRHITLHIFKDRR